MLPFVFFDPWAGCSLNQKSVVGAIAEIRECLLLQSIAFKFDIPTQNQIK